MLRRFLAGWLVAAAACGGGGNSQSQPLQITILTQTLDQGNVGKTYFQQLLATGGQGPYAWWVSSSGDPLPTGLALQPDGRLAGTPGQTANASVVLVVQDVNSQLDLVTMSLEVRDVEITGGTTQNLIPGTQLQFQAAGGSPGYGFSFTANQSGAQLTQSGSYTAGSAPGVDVVRATDTDGFYEETSVTVGDDPFVGFRAQYGSTDVWWIDFDVVYDTNPTFATDFDETLAAVGLRDPSSTGVSGSEADQVARLLAIRRVLAHLSSYYGNGPDGSLLPGGLAVSFPAPSAPAVGTTPPAGGVQGAAPNRYNTICVRYGPTPNVVGTAWLDPGNDSIEHDCGDPTGTALGIFSNRVLGPYLAAFNNSLASDPVNASDVAGLTAMLYGSAPANSREQDVWDVTDGFGRVLAAVLAHEIGHSLGLGHSGSSGEPPSSGSGDLMNAALAVSPSVIYAFNAGHWALLLSDLPGPNR